VVKKAISTKMARTRSPQMSEMRRNPLSATFRWLAWRVGTPGGRMAVRVIGWSRLGDDDLAQLSRGLLQQIGRQRSEVVLGGDVLLTSGQDVVEESLERGAL